MQMAKSAAIPKATYGLLSDLKYDSDGDSSQNEIDMLMKERNGDGAGKSTFVDPNKKVIKSLVE